MPDFAQTDALSHPHSGAGVCLYDQLRLQTKITQDSLDALCLGRPSRSLWAMATRELRERMRERMEARGQRGSHSGGARGGNQGGGRPVVTRNL